MHNEILTKFIENPSVLYIYEVGLQIYGLFSNVEDRDFLLVYDNNCIPKEFIKIDTVFYKYYEENEFGKYSFLAIQIQDWFELVLGNTIIAWECACLPKKYIHKEHVKLLLQTNPLALRQNYEECYNDFLREAIFYINRGDTLTGQKCLWKIVKYVQFANQIIENHKIINFKEVLKPYKQIVDGQVSDPSIIMEIFKKELFPHLERFKKYTDGMLAKSKLKYINQDVK